MNSSSIINALILVSLCYFIYSFKDWRNPEDFTYYLTRDLTEALSEQGIFPISNDLNDPLLKSRIIVINGAMNEQISKEVVRKLLYLNSLDQNKEIDLYISSQGGWYDSTFTIIETFHAINAPVNTICIGGCYSSGAVLLASGTGKRAAYPLSLISFHLSYGDDGDGRPYAERPDRINKYLPKMTNLPNDWFPLEDGRYYYLTSKQALDFSVIDTILDTQANKSLKRDH